MPGLTKIQIRELIKAHRTRGKAEREQWERYLQWYRSEYWGPTGTIEDDAQVTFETNYPYAFIDSMVSNIVPPNPQVTINARRSDKDEYATYREALANDRLKHGKASDDLRKLATFAAVCGRGFIKAVWRFSKEQTEFRVVHPTNVFFDFTAEKWEDIRYLIEVTTMTKEEFLNNAKQPFDPDKPRGKKRYDPELVERADFGSYPAWLKPAMKAQQIASEVFQYITVYEVYDFVGQKYYHYLDDEQEPLLADDLPYRFVKNPFYMLTLNDSLNGIQGLSDIQLIDKLQQMLNELDTLELRHAQSSIPVTLFHAGMVDSPSDFASNLMEASSPGDAVALYARDGFSIRDIIAQTPTANVLPAFSQMRQRIVQTIEFILGLPQYQRGVIGIADVATEVALADTAIRTRNGRRMQAINDTVIWMVKSIIGLYEEFLDAESRLPVRLTSRSESMLVTRDSLDLQNPNRKVLRVEPLQYDYDAVPYSPTENSKAMQLKNLTGFMDLFLQSPDVNTRKFIDTLVDLLNIPNILNDEEEVQAQQQAQLAAMMGGQGGGMPGPPGPADIAGPVDTAGGVTPENVAPGSTPPMPPNAAGGPGIS